MRHYQSFSGLPEKQSHAATQK